MRQAYDYWQDQPGNYGAKTYTGLLHTPKGQPSRVRPTQCLNQENKAFENGVNFAKPILLQTKGLKVSSYKPQERMNVQGSHDYGFDSLVLFRNAQSNKVTNQTFKSIKSIDWLSE